MPRGPEAAAVRRARPSVPVVELRAGAASASLLPAFAAGTFVVVLGVAGALRDRRVGDVVVYRSIADEGRRFLVGHATLAEQLGALSPTVVAACTTDHVVTTVAERARLAKRFDADVVDMEGTHLAAALFARNVGFAMVRVISDDAAHDMPALANAITASGGVNVPVVAAAFVRAPRSALVFARGARTALRRLEVVTAALTSR